MKWIRAVLAAVLLPVATMAAEKMNVLFIVVDDMNNDLGCYGSPIVKTPNIDRLAARGTRFDRAYCQFPLCSPSRTSVMTGLRPDTTRVFDLKRHFRDELPDVVTMGQLFKNDGRYSARVGKIFHYGNPGDIGTSGLDDAQTWTEFFNPAGRDKTVIEKDIINHTPKRGLGSSLSFLADATGKDEEHTDGMVATKVIELLEKHGNNPFFIGAGFYKPHCPYVAPKKYFDLYPLEQISLPEFGEKPPAGVPPPALDSTKPWPIFGVTKQQAREAKQAYYATISFVDAQIGRVLDALDRLKLTDKTVVLFWSDHGYHLGEHGLWKKQSCFEESARVPMIIAAPGQKGAGKATKRVVELVDLYPTVAEYAGLKAPANLHGTSLRPLLDDADAAWNRTALTQVQRGSFAGYSIRTERWRYTEWDGGAKGAELYDHDSDPHELKNLADDPQFAPVATEMKALAKKNWPVPAEGGRSKKNK